MAGAAVCGGGGGRRRLSHLFVRDALRQPYRPDIDVEQLVADGGRRTAENLRRRRLDDTLAANLVSLHARYQAALQREARCRDAAAAAAAAQQCRKEQSRRRRLKKLQQLLAGRRVALDAGMHRVLAGIPNSTSAASPSHEPRVIAESVPEDLPVSRLTTRPLDHVQLAERLGILRMHLPYVTDTKGYFLAGDGALLERALVRFTEDALQAAGFHHLSVPLLLTPKVIEACGQPVDNEHTQCFRLADHFMYMHDPLFLSGTSEHAIMGYLMRARVPAGGCLPLRLSATSPCFRSELSQGRLSRGLFRVHQFTKVEMVGLAADAAGSGQLFEELLRLQRALLDQLQLPYRVLEMPAHDLGLSAHRKVDIEAWMPGRGAFGEVSSCSDCTDYQTRRLYVRGGAAGGQYLHSVNATACAVPRLLIAILENFQTEDGSVLVPAALRPHMPPTGPTELTPARNWRFNRGRGLRFSKISFADSGKAPRPRHPSPPPPPSRQSDCDS